MTRQANKGRRAGLFIGGVMCGVIRRIFIDGKYVRKQKRKF